MKFFVTTHAKQRFKERFYDFGDVKNLLHILYNEAEDNGTLFNNRSFMANLYEAHGYDRRYVFRATKDVLFVGHDEGDRVVILTCFENKYCEVKTKFTGKKKESLSKRAWTTA